MNMTSTLPGDWEGMDTDEAGEGAELTHEKPFDCNFAVHFSTAAVSAHDYNDLFSTPEEKFNDHSWTTGDHYTGH